MPLSSYQSWGHCWVAPQKRARRSHGAGETEAVLAWGKLPAHLWFLQPSPLGSTAKFQFNPSTSPFSFPFAEIITNTVNPFHSRVTKLLSNLIT